MEKSQTKAINIKVKKANLAYLLSDITGEYVEIKVCKAYIQIGDMRLDNLNPKPEKSNQSDNKKYYNKGVEKKYHAAENVIESPVNVESKVEEPKTQQPKDEILAPTNFRVLDINSVGLESIDTEYAKSLSCSSEFGLSKAKDKVFQTTFLKLNTPDKPFAVAFFEYVINKCEIDKMNSDAMGGLLVKGKFSGSVYKYEHVDVETGVKTERYFVMFKGKKQFYFEFNMVTPENQ